MDIFELASVISAGDDMVLQYFWQHGLLRKGADCVPCGRAFSLLKDKVSVTGYMLSCPGCRKKEWLTKDSFFTKAHLSLRKVLALMYFLVTRHQCGTVHEPCRHLLRNGYAVVPVFPRHLFVEVAEHADCVGRRRHDCPD